MDRIVLELARDAVPVKNASIVDSPGNVCMGSRFFLWHTLRSCPEFFIAPMRASPKLFAILIRSMSFPELSAHYLSSTDSLPRSSLRTSQSTSYTTFDRLPTTPRSTFSQLLPIKDSSAVEAEYRYSNANFHRHGMYNIPGQYHGMTEVTRDDWSAKFKKEVTIWRLTK